MTVQNSNCPGLSKMSGFVSKNPGEVSQQKVHMKWLDAILKFFIWQT